MKQNKKTDAEDIMLIIAYIIFFLGVFAVAMIGALEGVGV